MMRRWKCWMTLVCAVGLLGGTSAHAQVTLKLATMAPDGSLWIQMLNAAKAEIETATAGAVKIKIYPGGIMGIEQDVMFKIKTGQLHGGCFYGYAVGAICPDSNALMFPMVFRDDSEVDPALDKMRPYLEEQARKTGFETMSWIEGGFSYCYSTKPIPDIPAIRATKVWGLDSPMLSELLAAAQISSIPVSVTDVLPALQTGLLETVFCPPTAMVAMQWHTKLRSYNSLRLTHAVGGTFISSAAWNTVPAAHRETVRSIFDKHSHLLTPKVRQSDEAALTFIQSKGVQALPETAEIRAHFDQVAAAALPKVMGSSFSVAAWDLLQQILLEIRAK